MFGSKVSSDEALADLKNQISDGNLGNLKVDPESLEHIYPTTQGIFPFLAILSIKAKQLTPAMAELFITRNTCIAEPREDRGGGGGGAHKGWEDRREMK